MYKVKIYRYKHLFADKFYLDRTNDDDIMTDIATALNHSKECIAFFDAKGYIRFYDIDQIRIIVVMQVD